MDQDRIVAVGLLTQGDLDRLGTGFRNVIPVKRDAMFDDLLAQLDQIEIEPAEHGVMLRSDHRG
ncbi:hypothetical protein [Sphingomonas turrisvirgatae]|uniref:Uncharacterized protein n=1 Tax=Sphingomonas turrisvirgatae TaxID=1888892 RepID=A0A1E3M2B2_9SPHN|nr:hypothetical protein [Sphingomonas turrisvirgatae]ODP39505.1 hypothetical protein BFL28_09095 [Sphingomonas turrisvirgatae]